MNLAIALCCLVAVGTAAATGQQEQLEEYFLEKKRIEYICNRCKGGNLELVMPQMERLYKMLEECFKKKQDAAECVKQYDDVLAWIERERLTREKFCTAQHDEAITKLKKQYSGLLETFYP